ncbi:hypothetical protein BRC63_03170, partial [Halobacteriales archaeon QH_10_70_21]
ERAFQAWVQPLGAATDDTSGAVLLAVDITGRRDHEAELEKRNERLKRVASVISHDLRGPLQIAQGHLELAQETGEAASFERAREAQGRIGTIIEDVLTLARTGQMITETERTELDDIAREAWKTVDTSSITLVVDGNCEMDAAPARLRQLFESLFRNAVAHGATDDASDAAGSGVTVTVGSIEVMPTSTRATTDAVRGFYVADDGVGMPEAERDESSSGVHDHDRRNGVRPGDSQPDRGGPRLGGLGDRELPGRRMLRVYRAGLPAGPVTDRRCRGAVGGTAAARPGCRRAPDRRPPPATSCEPVARPVSKLIYSLPSNFLT